MHLLCCSLSIDFLQINLKISSLFNFIPRLSKLIVFLGVGVQMERVWKIT